MRADFPVFTSPRSHRLVYLDSAASSQKPVAVMEAMDDYYRTTHANVHRGVYAMAEEATARFEAARSAVARFIGAASSREVLFSKNATESLNLVAHAWGRANLRRGDVVVLTEMEHHANLVPWLILAQQLDLELRYLGITDDGLLDLSDLDTVLDGARLVSFTAMSNVLGTLPPVRAVADGAHAAGAVVVVDASQYVPHQATDVTALGADFLAFTGHKMLGPTGIGVLWGRESLLEAMPPFLGGGEMIRDVRLDGFTCNELPWKFEAGTPPIAEAIGLGAAVGELERYTMEAIRAHEVAITGYALRTLADRYGDDLVVYGPQDPALRGGVISFSFRGIHPHDVSQVLDQSGVCVRAGHHCAKPLMRRLGVGATSRASFYLYNDESDVDALVDALDSCSDLFG
ncbi:MAG: SufS family cysteine desulfurase [Acidimicrobiia bacterium]|nr:SufS family cysteine desulfurase [Acidimicrobiia bacterium]MDQ3462841.1 SufS family cysteine desulfurase [Actinomycetota bacterium]